MFIYHFATQEKSFDETHVNEIPYAFDSESGVQAVNNGSGYVIARNSVPTDLLHSESTDADWFDVPDSPGWRVRQVADFSHDGMVRQSGVIRDGFWVIVNDTKILIPRAVKWQGIETAEVNLPRYDKLGKDGKWIKGDVFPRYLELWKAAGEILNAFTGSSPEAEESRQIDIMVSAIRTNYHASAIECSISNMLAEEFRVGVFGALIDLQGYFELKKKIQLGL